MSTVRTTGTAQRAVVEPRLSTSQFDSVLFGLAVLLSLIGIFVVWDAGYARAVRDGAVFPRELRNQSVSLVAALIAGFVSSLIGTGRLRKLAWPVFGVVVALLALLFVPGAAQEIGGARRWFSIGGFLLQPAEFTKVAGLVALSFAISGRPDRKPAPRSAGYLRGQLLPRLRRSWPLVAIVLAAALIEREPDLGTAAVLLVSAFAVVWVGGVSRLSLALIVASGALLLAGMIAAEPFRIARLLNHGDRASEAYRLGTGYQPVISQEALQRGGILGVGITKGQAKKELPVPTTDFAMTTVAEETGLVGALTVLGLVGWLVSRLFLLGMRSRDRFATCLCAGIATWIAVQSAVNVMMVNGTIPPIGIPMPFVSNGGSSLVAIWLGLGLCTAALRGHGKEVADASSGHRWRNRRARLSRD
ncbi:MAG: FtsW/RodA/SpoVE family cell cycle protein [Fimbriimonadaceae bacterium]|nr:FtsW/RodA/SpoVE family cell cycle protein [Fimbriimonadaceae bacterium]